MSDRYAKMTQDEFDETVRELAREDGVGSLLSIPGVWEHVSEFYNNAALERWEQEHPEAEPDHIRESAMDEARETASEQQASDDE